MSIKKNLFILFLFFLSITTVNAIYTDEQVKSYEEELENFSCEYKEKIEELHKIYPNAIFVAQKEFFDWDKYKEITVLWSDMLKAEIGSRSLISYTAQDSFKTSTCGQTSGSVCSWYYASQEAITYYMNPYNFLNEKNIFMFESLYSKDYHTKEGVEKILAGSFMANKECPGADGKTYAEVILEAGEKNNVSPYMLASRLIQEQGKKGTSSLISGTYEGYEGYYNYFNIQASGDTDTKIIENGLKCAKGTLTDTKGNLVCKGASWTSPYLSIIGGAKFVYQKYVGVNDTYNVKGQMTLYLQKWDPYGPKLGGHQYMQNIQAAKSESEITYSSYSSFEEFKNYKYVFYIPIYEGAPNTTSTSCKTSTDITIKSYTVKNNYISGIEAGTTQSSFINKIKSEISDASVSIQKNSNNQSDNLATGDKITITRASRTVTYEVVIYGDVNGDSLINSGDLLKLRQHLIGSSKLNDVYAISADINKDNNINSGDLLKLRQHLIGSNKISQ